jgi:hypothetical protein
MKFLWDIQMNKRWKRPIVVSTAEDPRVSGPALWALTFLHLSGSLSKAIPARRQRKSGRRISFLLFVVVCVHRINNVRRSAWWAGDIIR